jgi:AcrR family transcriptional regulator
MSETRSAGGTRRTRRRPARERLTRHVDNVLYRDGVHATVDQLIESAQVSRATFYSQFPTKEELIDTYLRARHDQVLDRLEEIAARPVALVEQVAAVFEHLLTMSQEPNFRGCAFVVAAAEMREDGGPAVTWARVHKRAVQACFASMIQASGVDAGAAQAAAEQLCILYDGALITAAFRPESRAIERAASMANLLALTLRPEP